MLRKLGVIGRVVPSTSGGERALFRCIFSYEFAVGRGGPRKMGGMSGRKRGT